ncbi:MAG TPA: zinc-ribbon and DUF3426 domain-containing protein [Methylococcus sp.]|nr:zinc-ribbon and DUF3426 domain-containing protein [Methylococcus sp.]
MYTRCPECKTVYRISVWQLREGQGSAFCESCVRVFNVLPSLAPSVEDAVPDAASRIEIPTLGRDDAFSQRMRDFAGRGERSLGFRYGHGRWQAEAGPGFLDRLVWGGGSVLLSLVLLGQLAYFASMRLAQNETWRPWLVVFCDAVGCELPPYRDVESIQVVERTLRPLAGLAAYEFRLTMSNQSTSPQAFPSVALTMTDRDGRPVAGRIFRPNEYLPKGEAASLMPVGKNYEIRLDLARPASDVAGFTFKLI